MATTPEHDVPTIDLIGDVCREVRSRIRHRVFVRRDGARYIVMDGEWQALPNRIRMTGALESGDRVGLRYENFRGLHGQWPALYCADDCERALNVWRRPLEVSDSPLPPQ